MTAERCPVCGAKQTQRWVRAAGTAIGWLIVVIALVLLYGALAAAVRWAF